MSKHSILAANILLVLLALLALGWAYGAIANWGEIASRPTRLAYIIADFGIVIPLGLIGALGVRAGNRSAYPLFILALGALLFDTAHGVLYLLWDNYFGVPWVVALLLLLALVGFVIFAVRAVATERPL